MSSEQINFQKQLFNLQQFSTAWYNQSGSETLESTNPLAKTPFLSPTAKRSMFGSPTFGQLAFNYPSTVPLKLLAGEPGTDLLMNSAQFNQGAFDSGLALFRFQTVLRMSRTVTLSSIDPDQLDETYQDQLLNQAAFNTTLLNLGVPKRYVAELFQIARSVVRSNTPQDRDWLFLNALFNRPTHNRATFNQTQLVEGVLFFEKTKQLVRSLERVRIQRASVQFRVYPPYQKIRQYQHADQKMLPLAVSEMLIGESQNLFVAKQPGQHGTNVILYTDQTIPGQIYTTVTHPTTKMPLFFKHSLPKFGFESEFELRSQIKIFRDDGTLVPESLYHVIADDQSGTIQVWTNLRSGPEEVYFLEINPSPNQKHGIRHVVLLDSRIDQKSFQKPAGFCWQLDLGYKRFYVPSGLDQDSPWPLLMFSLKRNVFACRQKAVRIREGLYKVKPLLYVGAYCDFKVKSISSHGFALIDSNLPVVDLVCEYEQFGDVVLPDMRANDYQAWSVLVESGEKLELL